MNQLTLMSLKIFLPSGVYNEKNGISRIVAETLGGSFGLLPHRLDCVAVLVPGIITCEDNVIGEMYVAVDEGILIKTGLNVLVSVRNAISGTDLSQLRESVEREFLEFDERERGIRSVMAKLESSFVRQIAEIHR